jgi:predicted metal-dependent hydrolase
MRDGIPYTIPGLIESLFSNKKQNPVAGQTPRPSSGAGTPAGLILRLEDGREIPYRIRVSPRARSVRLRLAAREGLTVVTPAGFPPERVEGLLFGKRTWIARHWQRLEQQNGLSGLAALPAALRPEGFELPAVGESWEIEYRQTAARTLSARSIRPGRLLVSGPVDDHTGCRAVLRRWLLRHAHHTLQPWLKQVSLETGLAFSGLRVRLQRSRWGSCTSRKTISLNAKLLFLPPELVRYVMLHELSHTRELNHSPRFWALLERWDPAARDRHAAFRHIGRGIPGWVVADDSAA